MAFDTAWKHGIMMDLENMGLKGLMPKFIKAFLTSRTFKVRQGTTLSDQYSQEMGVPQGSILSPTLFNIKINSIVKNVKLGMECSIYADDFLIYYRSKNMSTIERQMQQSLSKLQEWADRNGF